MNLGEKEELSLEKLRRIKQIQECARNSLCDHSCKLFVFRNRAFGRDDVDKPAERLPDPQLLIGNSVLPANIMLQRWVEEDRKARWSSPCFQCPHFVIVFPNSYKQYSIINIPL